MCLSIFSRSARSFCSSLRKREISEAFALLCVLLLFGGFALASSPTTETPPFKPEISSFVQTFFDFLVSLSADFAGVEGAALPLGAGIGDELCEGGAPEPEDCALTRSAAPKSAATANAR